MVAEPRLVIVGELNPYGADPFFALYHLPRKASGNQLRKHLGLEDSVYEDLHKVNLCTGKWSMKAARAEASKLLEVYDVLVLCGVKVTAAFSDQKLFTIQTRLGETEKTLVSIGHPSGLSRAWNDPRARPWVRDVLRPYIPQIP